MSNFNSAPYLLERFGLDWDDLTPEQIDFLNDAMQKGNPASEAAEMLAGQLGLQAIAAVKADEGPFFIWHRRRSDWGWVRLVGVSFDDRDEAEAQAASWRQYPPSAGTMPLYETCVLLDDEHPFPLRPELERKLQQARAAVVELLTSIPESERRNFRHQLERLVDEEMMRLAIAQNNADNPDEH